MQPDLTALQLAITS